MLLVFNMTVSIWILILLPNYEIDFRSWKLCNADIIIFFDDMKIWNSDIISCYRPKIVQLLYILQQR